MLEPANQSLVLVVDDGGYLRYLRVDDFVLLEEVEDRLEGGFGVVH